jgi:hypothetical protein
LDNSRSSRCKIALTWGEYHRKRSARQQLIADYGIELLALAFRQFLAYGLFAKRAPIRSIGGHRVNGVSEHDNAGLERDRVTRETVGISAAVPVFVMMTDRRHQFAKVRHRSH